MAEKLKKGDKVLMYNCLEAHSYGEKVWTCRTDSFERAGSELVFLKGFPGSFYCEFLQRTGRN